MAGYWMTWMGLTAALLSIAGVGLATALARRAGMLVQPGGRGSHLVVTPTGGGAGLVAALIVLTLLPGFSGAFPFIWRQAVLPGLVLLGLVGWLDDRHGVSVALRLAVQLGVSWWLVISMGGPGNLGPGGGTWSPLLMVACLIVLVWVMNAYNFMDGSHGMAGAQGVFAGLLVGLLMTRAEEPGLAAAGIAVAGASAGFLPWNLPTPRVFMGDAGSVPLGFALGSLLLAAVVAGKAPLPVALLVLGVFLTDSTMTLLKRIITGERWYTPHRQHEYQRLIAAGWSHGRVLGLYQAFNFFLILPAAVLGMNYPTIAWPLAGFAYLVMVTMWCIKSLKSGGNP